jgi:Protein of unknown function (DUF2971)
MIIYRYLNALHGIQALQTRKLKVSRLLELNDPLDCQPTLKNLPTQYSTDDQRTAFEQQYLRQIFNSVGIICYSDAIQDPVIWSHYAEAHKGIALGFELPLNADERGPAWSVRYSSNLISEPDPRVQLNYNDLEEFRKQHESLRQLMIAIQGFTTKASSWRYEREWRDFLWLDGCEMDGLRYYSPMRPRLEYVILGVNSPLTESDVRRALSPGKGVPHLAGPVEIVRARFQRSSFWLDIPFTRIPPPPPAEAHDAARRTALETSSSHLALNELVAPAR